MFREELVFRNRKLVGCVLQVLEERFSGKSKVDRYPTSEYVFEGITCSAFDLIKETALQILRMSVIALRWAFESP